MYTSGKSFYNFRPVITKGEVKMEKPSPISATIQVEDIEIPKYLLKFSSNFEHLKAMQQGIMYMKEVAYYRKCDNKYQGDISEGKILANPKGFALVALNKERTTVIDRYNLNNLNVDVDNYLEIDKIPMLCCSEINKTVLIRKSENMFLFDEIFLKHMRQFGENVLVFSEIEFLTNIRSFAENKGLEADFIPIKYLKSNELLNGEALFNILSTGQVKNPLQHLFLKRSDYSIQNEYRLILYKKDLTPIIDSDKDFFSFQIEPLKHSKVINFKDAFKFGLNVE